MNDDDSHLTGQTSSVEVERTYDVPLGLEHPLWAGVPDVAAVSRVQRRELDATYFDTPELDLARSGFALRRRVGGHDAGWHLKGPRTGDSRVETQWPLTDSAEVPTDALAAVQPIIGLLSLQPIARIINVRRAVQLFKQADFTGGFTPGGTLGSGNSPGSIADSASPNAASNVLAEFVDDHVRSTDFRTGSMRQWREWELELGSAASDDPDQQAALFERLEQVVFAAGALPAKTDSKLARALGL